MSTNKITSYPFLLPEFGDGSKNIVLEEDFLLYYGKRRTNSGTYELYADIKSRYYPHNSIQDGEKSNIQVYKQGKEPSAFWALPSKSKNIYLFLSQTTSYISDSPTLPEDILENFDSEDVDISIGTLKNEDNLYSVLVESGAIFDSSRSYRQFAIVRSSKNGKLYQKTTPGRSVGDSNQKDPSENPSDWEKVVQDSVEITKSQFVDLSSSQEITGKKTFNEPYKSSLNSKITALELVSYGEIERLFLQKTATAENSRKLQDLEIAKEGGGNKESIVVTNSEGKIPDSFLNFNMYTDEETVIEVDPSRADNIKVFSTIQEAYDSLIKIIKLGNIKIKVSNGVYSREGEGSVLDFTKIYDMSTITIEGNIDNPEQCIIQIKSGQQGVYFTGKGLYMNGFTFSQTDSDKGVSIGLNITDGASAIFGRSTIIKGCNKGINLSGGSYLNGEYITFSNCNTAAYVDSSVANLNNSRTDGCDISYEAVNNSTIYARGAEMNRIPSQINTTIGFKSTFNSVIRALDSNGTVDNINFENTPSCTQNSTGGIVEYNN